MVIESKDYLIVIGMELDWIINYSIEIGHLLPLYFTIGQAYITLTDTTRCGDTLAKSIPYFEQALSILESWRLQLSIEESNRVDILDDEKISTLYDHLSQAYFQLGKFQLIFRNNDAAIAHLDKAISYAELVEMGMRRAELLCNSFTHKGEALKQQLKNEEARPFFEEAYNVMAIQCRPDHPLVLEAANWLIEILIQLDEFYDAERYARIAYECQLEKDTESIQVAECAISLATCTLFLITEVKIEVSKIEEAEILARKAIQIAISFYGQDDYREIARFLTTLDRILQYTGGHNVEAKHLLERSLAIVSKGGDENNIAIGNSALSAFHYNAANRLTRGIAKKEELHLAESYSNEAVRIS